MKLKRTPELLAFLSTCFPDVDGSAPEADERATRAYFAAAPADRRGLVVAQANRVLQDPELPIDELGSEANRWFGAADEAREWLRRVVGAIEAADAPETNDAAAGQASAIPKDSNGAPLAEGDSVQVIKDLKVKGGSSDLKRGTLIKKIHLTGDPEAIECRVDGSTLVLKTCFLKKA